VGTNLAAWRGAVPDDGLEVRRRAGAGRIAGRTVRQWVKGYPLRVSTAMTLKPPAARSRCPGVSFGRGHLMAVLSDRGGYRR
jgi:hypothetical protein